MDRTNLEVLPLCLEVSLLLGSTDAAPEVPHPRPTRPDAATRRGRRCPRVRQRPAASGHVDPTWVSSTRADASRFGFDARRREPFRADSGLNRPVSAGIGRNGRNSRFRPKFKKKKKKKKPRTHRLLNSNPTSAQMHSKRQKHSSHYISLTLSLC